MRMTTWQIQEFENPRIKGRVGKIDEAVEYIYGTDTV